MISISEGLEMERAKLPRDLPAQVWKVAVGRKKLTLTREEAKELCMGLMDALVSYPDTRGSVIEVEC